ncbi:unnamed protein product [Orchesella dallaii]|uniref:Protein transport protein Sec31A n=1 Tax=Orchesella dallaii TaxID=48710 RepID=A0ABP1QDS9_9HEXA
MKIKEIDRTASVAWSPAKLDNIYLAAGTAAQQLDSSFSTNAALELYQLNVNEPGLDVPIKATYNCESRFHKLVWGCHGVGGEKNEFPAGLIVGGCDGGVMQVFNAYKLFQNEDPIVLTKSKHAGPVRALDFNCFRPNLIASGASESEIFIWDLTNPKVPMSPGAKIQPADDVTDLEWNKQVEHILASTFPARCVVWDLRKNEPVIKVSDATSRIRYKCVRWHPEVATQMCLASEDDASPVIQLWDLRYATSPLRVIQGHQRGILGMSWCAQDPELLLTCGKDSRILCWNPNYAHAGYEMVLDIPTSSQWSFDVSFCPKNPIVASSCTFDGRISMYGLSGGAQQPVTSSKLADSFPGMDMSMSHAPLPTQPTTSQQLRDPPKWMKRPSGVSFAFGGRLISFQNVKTPATQAGQPDRITGTVNISQIVTLPEFIDRSKKLEEALQTGSLEFYCSEKARVATDSQEARIWEFLQASFSQNPRQAYVSLLGFNTSEMLTKLQEVVNTGDIDALINNFDELGNDNAQDNLGTLAGYQNGFGGLDIHENIPEFSVPTDDSTDGRINQALLCGNIDLAVYLCLETERWADAFLLASKGSAELMIKAQSKYFQKVKGKSTNMIRAVVRQDLNYLVSNCELDSWKQVLATALTYADETGFQTVAETLGQRLLKSEDDNLVQGALLCFICSGSLNHLVDAWVGGSGKGSSPDELQDLVEQVMILKKAADMWGRDANLSGGSLAGKMIEYASILASQGCLDTALNYLKDSNDPSINALKERLQLSLGYVKPTRQQIAPRSRQTSESSASGLRYKRPSHPSAPVKRGSDLYQQTDFSNLTGPVQPPSAYSSSSGLNSGYGASQYSPAPPSNNPGLLTYAQTNSANSVPSGLPPRPPTTATPGAVPALYNPAGW